MRSLGRIRKPLWTGVVAALVVAVAPVGATQAGAAAPAPYYLALGDSLSQGVQPNSSGASVETDRGYVDDLYSVYKQAVPGLRLVKLGCPGETTTTMIDGGICSYTEGSQLAQALSFLRNPRHHVVLVTLDIGANNVDDCVTASSLDLACVENGITQAASELRIILGSIRAAARGAQVVGMNYYDPFLAAWLEGSAGRVLAGESVTLTTTFNSDLDSVYAAFGDPVADVQSAFHTTDWTPIPLLGVPVNVAAICALTWMCAPFPVGPNIHANDLGYWVIAGAFLPEIRFSPLHRQWNPARGRIVTDGGRREKTSRG